MELCSVGLFILGDSVWLAAIDAIVLLGNLIFHYLIRQRYRPLVMFLPASHLSGSESKDAVVNSMVPDGNEMLPFKDEYAGRPQPFCATSTVEYRGLEDQAEELMEIMHPDLSAKPSTLWAITDNETKRILREHGILLSEDGLSFNNDTGAITFSRGPSDAA